MALDVKIRKRTLNFSEDKKEVYVATADRNGVIDTEKMAKVIAKDTGARPAQVKMILTSLQDNLMEWLEEGHGVRFGDIGTFLPSVKGKSADNADGAEVQRVKVTFIPNRNFSRKVAAISVNTVSDDDNESTSSSGSTDAGGSDNEGGQDFT